MLVAAKKCGCDAIVIRGRAAEPAILIVDDGEVRFEAAGPPRGPLAAWQAALWRSIMADDQRRGRTAEGRIEESLVSELDLLDMGASE